MNKKNQKKINAKIEYLKLSLKNNAIVIIWWLVYTALVLVVPCVMLCKMFGFANLRTGYKIAFGGAITIFVVIVYMGKTINEYITKLHNSMIRTVLKTAKSVICLLILYYILRMITVNIADLQTVCLWALRLNIIGAIPLFFTEEFQKRMTADEILHNEEMAQIRKEEREIKRQEKIEKSKDRKKDVYYE